MEAFDQDFLPLGGLSSTTEEPTSPNAAGIALDYILPEAGRIKKPDLTNNLTYNMQLKILF